MATTPEPPPPANPASPSCPPWLGPLLFVCFWCLLLLAGPRFLGDPGTFWHTVTGERILDEGFLDRDPYTFSHQGQPWLPYHWLAEVAMALAHRVGGLDWMMVLAAAIVAWLFAWIAVRLIETGLHPIFAIGVLLLTLATVSSHIHIRPHLFTMVAMVLTMMAVIALERGRVGLRGLTLLVPLYVVWSNVHGGMLGGLATLGLAWLGWLMWRGLGWESPIDSLRTGVGLALIGLACGLASLVTPYGSGIPRVWIYISVEMRLTEIIVEHGRLDVREPSAWPVLAFGLLYLAVLAGTLPSVPHVSWLVPLFWLVQSFLRVRHGSLFALVGVVALIDMWPHTRYARWLAANRPDIYTPRPPGKPALGAITATAIFGVTLALIVQQARLPLPLLGPGCARLDPESWPVELLDVLQENEPGPNGANLFNDLCDGGFIVYHTPRYRTFVDDRCELYGDAWLHRFVQARNGDATEAMTDWQQRYGPFDFALTRSDTGFDTYFRERPNEWRLLKATPLASFYQRLTPEARNGRREAAKVP